MGSIRTELRKEFPEIPFGIFHAILETGDPENLEERVALRELLTEEQEKAIAKKIEGEEEINIYVEQITSRLAHRLLHTNPIPGIDLEHLQAYLVYGFMTPTQRRTFAGKRKKTLGQVQREVANRLGVKFDPQEFNRVERFLIAHKIIVEHRRGAYSLSLHGNSDKNTEDLIAGIREFLHTIKTQTE